MPITVRDNELIEFKKGDLNASLRLTVARDLSAATSPAFSMVSAKDGEAKISAQEAVVENSGPTGSTLRYDWASEDVDEAGEFIGHFSALLSAKQETFPADRFILVRIREL